MWLLPYIWGDRKPTRSLEAPKASAERDRPARLGALSSRLAATTKPSRAWGCSRGSGSLYAEPAALGACQCLLQQVRSFALLASLEVMSFRRLWSPRWVCLNRAFMR